MNVDQSTRDRSAASACTLARALHQMRAKADRADVGALAGDLRDLDGHAATIFNDLVSAGAVDPHPDLPAASRPMLLHLLWTRQRTAGS